MEPDKPNYFAVIPGFVRYHPAISNGAKLLYGEITALCNEKGYCWASNAYFAKLYKVDARTIKRWIRELSDAKTIFIRVAQADGNARQIRISNKKLPSDKNVTTSGQKCPDPSDKNVTQNNTVNSTVNITHTEGVAPTQEWVYPMKPLLETFPHLTDLLTPSYIGFIESNVLPGDEEAWRRTLEIYRMNYDPMLQRYLPDKVGNILSVFRNQKAEVFKEQQNGTNQNNGQKRKRTDADVFRESAAFYAEWEERERSTRPE
jgi:hypothetical protein